MWRIGWVTYLDTQGSWPQLTALYNLLKTANWPGPSMLPRNSVAWAHNATTEKSKLRNLPFEDYTHLPEVCWSAPVTQPPEHSKNPVHWKLVNSFPWGFGDFVGTFPLLPTQRSTKAPRERAILFNRDSLANILNPVYFVKLVFNFSCKTFLEIRFDSNKGRDFQLCPRRQMPERCGHTGKIFLVSQGNCVGQEETIVHSRDQQQAWWCTCWSQRITFFFKLGYNTSIHAVSLAILGQLKLKATWGALCWRPVSSHSPCSLPPQVPAFIRQMQHRSELAKIIQTAGLPHSLKRRKNLCFLCDFSWGPVRILLCIIDVFLEVWG